MNVFSDILCTKCYFSAVEMMNTILNEEYSFSTSGFNWQEMEENELQTSQRWELDPKRPWLISTAAHTNLFPLVSKYFH